jgi:NAD(P)-dependent dehydrogenase (short-subunit alcohol dehydrogenase family)
MEAPMEADGSRVAVVTGASAGVGRATVRAFAARGWSVGLVARGREGLEAAVREVREAGGRALAVSCDVADAAGMNAACARFEEQLGPIDVWVNNAMTSVFSPVVEMTADEYQRVTDVTYLGCVHGTLAALRSMRARDRGVIVQVGSALAHRSIPLQSAYCAAKHAILGFTESLWSELLHDHSHVRVCVVQLPALNTPQFSWVKSRLRRKPQPVPPIFQPEVAATAIVHAALHPRRELYVGFPTVKAIVAEKIVPGWIDRWLAKHGYESQQTRELDDAARANDLLRPVAGDAGAHGSFDASARNFSVQLWLNTHRAIALGAALGGVALAAAIVTKGRFW